MKLDFDIDRKSANFDIKNQQNISKYQIITELSTFSFHYELFMKFSWNPKDSHNRYELYIAWWNQTLEWQFCATSMGGKKMCPFVDNNVFCDVNCKNVLKWAYHHSPPIIGGHFPQKTGL